MKKALLLVCILFMSVITTACINSFAVQELNNKAMTFMEQGNYPEAIERLKASIDLDDSVFESHYNLAVAYTKSDDYVNAMKAYQKAIKIKPDFPDSYYSLAVTEENLASDLKSGVLRLNDDGELVKPDENKAADAESEVVPSEIKLTPAEKIYIQDLLKDSVNNYNLYLTRSVKADDADEVRNHISEVEKKIVAADESKE